MNVMQQAPTQETSAPLLAVTLLGAPQLRYRGQPLVLSRRQMRALFYRLAANMKPVPREQLCFLLWPDIPDATARRQLTVLLNQLRQALPQPEMVLAQGDTITLDMEQIQVDTVLLAAVLAAATQGGAVASLAAAVDLYTGAFLEGFSLPTSGEYDNWVAQERQLWERRYLDALTLLVHEATMRGNSAVAVAAAQRALLTDPLNEEMHRRLMALYAAQGDRAAALRQFELCVLALERELGVSPLPETRAVYEAIRAGQVPLGHADGAGARLTLAPSVSPAPAPGEVAVAGTASPSATLPAATVPLIGRQGDLAAIYALLTGSSVRLLTLTGPGGSGKTRLAIQAAWNVVERFADGVVFVQLAPLRDPDLVISAIGHACGLTQTTLAALSDHLRAKQILLVLDNFEHLLTVAPELAALLAAAPGLRLLVTSRSALNLHGEHIFTVPPLPLPDLAALPSPSALAQIPAVALLLARTQAVNPRFHLTTDTAADVAAICVRLDGLPLAIELAAARLKVLTPRDLVRRLDQRLALLTQGARDLPERHQTLRATIDWSYQLLNLDEQIWFERCSIFAGKWTLAAVEAIDEQLRQAAGFPSQPEANTAYLLDVLATLVDKSLIQVQVDDDGVGENNGKEAGKETGERTGEVMRFSMLETLREFAAEQLQLRGNADAVARAHADYYTNLVTSWDYNAPPWLNRIDREVDNLRAALRWLLDHPAEDGIHQAMRLGETLGRYFYWRDWITEGRWWVDQLVAQTEGIQSAARATVLSRAARLATVQGDTEGAITLNEATLQLSRELQLGKLQTNALVNLGIIYSRRGDFAHAIRYLEESVVVARHSDSPEAMCNSLYILGGVLLDQGEEISRALALFEECLEVARYHHHPQPLVESMTLACLGLIHTFTGNLARAAELLPMALRMQRELNATMSSAWTLQYLGILAYFQAGYGRAGHYFVESMEAKAQGGTIHIIPVSLEGVAGVAAQRGQPIAAARLLGAAEALRESIELHRPPLEASFYDPILAAVRDRLAESELQQAWQVGRTLTAAQAIAEAEQVTRGRVTPDVQVQTA